MQRCETPHISPISPISPIAYHLSSIIYLQGILLEPSPPQLTPLYILMWTARRDGGHCTAELYPFAAIAAATKLLDLPNLPIFGVSVGVLE